MNFNSIVDLFNYAKRDKYMVSDEAWVEDKHSNARPGDVRRWSDGKLHEKTTHGWRVLPNGSQYDVVEKEKEGRKNLKKPLMGRPATNKEFSDFIDKLNKNPGLNSPISITLPRMNRSLMKQIGLDKNDNFIFSQRFYHVSPARKKQEGQDLRIEEYKQIPDVIKNAKFAILSKGTGNFKIIFPDKKDDSKYNKIVFNKYKKGNYVVTLGKVDKYNIFDKKTEKIVGEGVPPSI